MCGRRHLLGARASRPHNDWHGLGHLLRLNRPAAAPWLSFGLAVVVTADLVAACKAARKLSDHHKQQHAGGTPALPGDKQQHAGGTPALPGGYHSALEEESQKPSRQAMADAVGGQPMPGTPPFAPSDTFLESVHAAEKPSPPYRMRGERKKTSSRVSWTRERFLNRTPTTGMSPSPGT